ncbi:MAG: sugar phosphate isomerase/epimerase family protein [Eubacteriales bacterium]
MMKIGIESGAYLDRYGFAEGLARMKAHGYEALDYQSFVDTETELFRVSEAEFERTLRAQRAAIEEAGIEITQTHGPWRWPPRDFTEEDRAERFEKMAKSIRGTAILGCRNFVIHPIMPFGDNQDPEPERLWDMNLAFMSRLVEVGRSCDVVVNFENMPMTALSISRPEAILRFVKMVDSPFFKVCLDTGHCAVFGDSPAQAVRLLGKEYLATLHIHDNNGRNDLHWNPYTGVIDWDDFSAALREIGFEGAVSLETAAPGRIPQDIREPFERGLFHMARRIAGR